MRRPRHYRRAVGGVAAASLLLGTGAAAAPAEPASPTAPAAAEPAEPEASTAAQEQPIEVEVLGARPLAPAGSTGEHRLGRREIERLPGAFGDALRAVDVLPGVTPFVSGLPHFVVRGAMPSSTGYFIDGIGVPFLYHLGIGPSVVSPALVHSIDFFPGPYPAEWGRHVGGVISATTPPPAYRWRGEAELRVFDMGAFLEVPIADGRADVFAAGRYSYTAAILSLFTPSTSLSYWDYQAGAGYELSPRDRLRLLVFGSRDYLGETVDDTEHELFGAEFHRIHLRLDHAPPRTMSAEEARNESRARAGVTFGYDRSGLGEEGVMRTLGLGVRADGEVPLGSIVRLRAGTDLQIDDHRYEPRDDAPQPEPTSTGKGEVFSFDVSDAFAAGRTNELGAYLDLVLRPIDEVEIVPGMRADLFAEQGLGKVGLDPRATVRVRPLPWLTSITAAGVAHQRPMLIVAVPGLDPRALAGGLQEAVQLSQGVQVNLPADIEASAAGFYHHYAGLTDLSATCGVGTPTCSIGDRADGRAYGLELALRRALSEDIGGLVSYTLSRAERTVGGERILADFDRTHVLHVALGVMIGRGWHAGVRFTTYTGRPYSLLAFDDPTHPEDPTLIGKRNALRRPAFYRLDARVEKRWHIGETGWVSLVLEGMNLTLSKETVDFDCRVIEVLGGRGGLSCGGQEIGPITIPSLGVSGGF